MERFWYGLAMKNGQRGPRQLDLVLTVQITLDYFSYDLTERAKEAWMKMRVIHPGIAAFTEGDEWIYKVEDHDE